MNVVLLGGTRGIGRALARLMAARGDRLFLLGRDDDSLQRSRSDCEAARPGACAGTAHCDLERPDGFGAALDRAAAGLGGFDTVVLTAAQFDTQENLEANPAARHRMLGVDFTNSIAFCEEARVRLLERGGGTLAVFSSVAGDRPRKPVVFYGAAKAGLTFYLRGIDLRFRERGLRTVCVKPGFVHTGMTAGLDAPPFAATAERVAAIALRGIDRGRPELYAPPIWRWIMGAIRALPTPVMRRVRF